MLDRGYMAFALLRDVIEAGAAVVMRAYNNIVVETLEELPVTIPAAKTGHWSDVRDRLVRSQHPDAKGLIFRLVEFTIGPSTDKLITNRTDLTTFQVMLIYAYRWQIELIFRFFKHTMTGIQVISTTPWGVENFFSGLFLTAVLHLYFNRDCLEQEGYLLQDELENTSNVPDKTVKMRVDPQRPTVIRTIAQFMAIINRKFTSFWKVSKYWLATLAELLHRPFTADVVHVLNKRAIYGCSRL